TKLTGNVKAENPQSERTFEIQGFFERGEIYKIDSSVYVTPFPTDEEMFAFFLAGNIRSVVNLLDSSDEDANMRIKKESKALEGMNIVYRSMPVTEHSTEKDVLPILNAIDSLPKPLVVHQWNTTSEQSILFRKAYYNKSKFIQINLA